MNPAFRITGMEKIIVFFLFCLSPMVTADVATLLEAWEKTPEDILNEAEGSQAYIVRTGT